MYNSDKSHHLRFPQAILEQGIWSHTCTTVTNPTISGFHRLCWIREYHVTNPTRASLSRYGGPGNIIICDKSDQGQFNRLYWTREYNVTNDQGQFHMLCWTWDSNYMYNGDKSYQGQFQRLYWTRECNVTNDQGQFHRLWLTRECNETNPGRASFTSYTGPGTIMLWTRVTGPVSQPILDHAGTILIWTRVTGPVSQAMLDQAL